MYPSVVKVTPMDDYILYISFDNGENGQLDIKPILNFGVFNRIKDQAEFKNVKVLFDTIEWACGADLDPEYIYKKCIKDS